MNGILCKENVSQEFVDITDKITILDSSVSGVHCYSNGRVSTIMFTFNAEAGKWKDLIRLDNSLINANFGYPVQTITDANELGMLIIRNNTLQGFSHRSIPFYSVCYYWVK